MNEERFIGAENHQTWIRHALFACAGLVVLTLISSGYFVGGYFRMTATEFLLLFGIAWLGQGLLLWLIHSGRSRRFADPSLTAAFMIWSTGLILLLAYYVDVGNLAGGTRLSLMMMFFGVLLFGSLRLSARWFYAIAMLAGSGYGYIVYLVFTDAELSKGITEPIELIQILMFVFLTAVLAKTGAVVAMLQRRLQQENVTLEENAARIRELAIRDDLTGLFNRRHVMDLLREQKHLADSGGYSFVIGYVDLDHFKRVNDMHGHGAGDAVLQRFAGILRQSIREVDCAGRVGGEEFVVILTHTRLAEALVVMERICSAIMAEDFSTIQRGLKVTTSIGVTAYAPVETLESLLGRADRLLYQAKQSGRNRVVSADRVL